MRISAIETRRYAVPFAPPFLAAWDPEPRTRQEATLVIVHTDEGLSGYAGGGDLPDRELLERLLVGVDPLRTEVVRSGSTPTRCRSSSSRSGRSPPPA